MARTNIGTQYMSTTAQQYDISELAEFMRRSKKDNKPYVFFTGAGCSKTAGIPLAGELITEMQHLFRLELKPLSENDRKDYGKCMAQIGRDDRRRFLKKYIDKARINWAHIALASLLDKGYICRVLTFNFDNLLARSCGLLGLYPAIYDLTSADLNLYRLIDNPAVVHLHGQSHGFAQLNSDEETQHHAEKMSSFISDILTESPSLFIGYSGKADAFFPQIQGKYSGQHRLFWVDMSEYSPTHIVNSIRPSELVHYMRCVDGADLFLIELARELKCFPPTIFNDPYSHMIEELSAVVQYPISGKKERVDEGIEFSPPSSQMPKTEDVLSGVIRRLKEAQQNERNNMNTDFLQLFLEGEYEQVISQANITENLNEEDSLLLANSYLEFALKQSNLSDEINLYEALIQRFGDSTETDLQELVAQALLKKGFAFGQMNHTKDAVQAYDELVERFGERSELVFHIQVANALLNKGITFEILNLNHDEEAIKEAIKAYGQVERRFETSSCKFIQDRVGAALLNKGICLRELNLLEDAIKDHDKVIQKGTELDLHELLARGLVNKGITLEKMNRPEDAIEVYDEVKRRFSESTEPVLLERVARALVFKGTILKSTHRVEDAINVYDEVIQRFSANTEPAIKELVTQALAGKSSL